MFDGGERGREGGALGLLAAGKGAREEARRRAVAVALGAAGWRGVDGRRKQRGGERARGASGSREDDERGGDTWRAQN